MQTETASSNEEKYQVRKLEITDKNKGFMELLQQLTVCLSYGMQLGKESDGLSLAVIHASSMVVTALRPADMLLYSWKGGLDVCVDLTGSSPLTQTEMVHFMPGRAVIDVAQRKRERCGDLTETDRKFSMAQDIGARAAVHIFNRISFSIAKGVGAQIVSRLPSNLL
ncbi:hypothetical protein Tco_0964036 [Tanacetum coccineum]